MSGLVCLHIALSCKQMPLVVEDQGLIYKGKDIWRMKFPFDKALLNAVQHFQQVIQDT